MAKAQYHKNQRVYVKPVGTWALVERVIPHWAKGLDEPLRVFYDVGLGREFAATLLTLVMLRRLFRCSLGDGFTRNVSCHPEYSTAITIHLHLSALRDPTANAVRST